MINNGKKRGRGKYKTLEILRIKRAFWGNKIVFDNFFKVLF